MKKRIIHNGVDFKNMRELVEWAGEEYGDKIAYSYKVKATDKDAVKKSFVQLRSDVRALSCELSTMGISGKKCAVIGKLSYDWALLYFSIISMGGVIVPLDRDWHAHDLADTAARAEVSFLFIDEDIADKADTIAAGTELVNDIVYMSEKKSASNVNALVEAGRKKFEDNSGLYFGVETDPYVMSLLVFTSGTTGKGKGVMLSQNAILRDVFCALPYIDYSDKTIGLLPPHHTYGSTIIFIGHAMIGSEVYISGGLRYVSKELKEQKPGHLVLVPLYLETFYRKISATVKEQGKEKMLHRMIKVSNFLRKLGIDLRKKFFASVRAAFGGDIKTVISGGAPINQEIMDFFEAIGIETLNGYGITECAPLIAFTRSGNVVKGSVGNPIAIDTIKIDEPNEDGEGEILVKGPNVMLGYYKDEEATKEAIDSEGYFKTGDYGKVDDKGILYITGRKKNLIILSNGKNVYPEEIENELIATPGVLDIIVYEGQSKRGLEHNAIVCEIYPDKEYCEKNSITDVKAHLKPYVDEYNRGAVPYKKITVIKVRDEEFPKNTLRKIMRFKLDMTID